MIVRIFIWMGAFIAISLVILWIVGGGVGRIAERAKGSGELSRGWFLDVSTFRLPWQPDLVPGIDFSQYDEDEEVGAKDQPVAQSVTSLQKEYETLEAATREASDFGVPSPHRDAVYIQGTGRASSADPDAEYLRISTAQSNTAPVDITGWSLQSAVSGVRAYFPRGAYDFRMGAVNEQRNMQLDAGASAFLTTGYSPIGTSFRENLCVGYLNQLQTFSPRLPERCPSPSSALPLTAENLNLYGDACIDFARTLPSCRAPLGNFPQ